MEFRFTNFVKDTDPANRMETLIHNPPCEGESLDCPLGDDKTQIHLVFLRGEGDPPDGRRRLGRLTVDSSGANVDMPTRVTVSELSGAAGAKLQFRQIQEGVVAATSQLPEPGTFVSLTSGLLGLALLHRLRQRRLRRRS